MANFVYLFKGGADMSKDSPAEMQANMQKWRAWMDALAKSGNFKAGDPLERGGTQVSGRKKVVTDGPFAEAKDLVGGYMLLTAANLAQATELAKGCPILDRDGTVEVRPVMEMTV